VLAGWCIHLLQLSGANLPLVVLVCAVACGVLARTRFHAAGWTGTIFVAGATIAIGYTPLMSVLLRQIVVQDELGPADAVVVLSADIYPDGTPSLQSQRRLRQAYYVLRQGYARRLVVTLLFPPKPSAVPFVRRHLRRQQLNCPVDEVGPIWNTHDEALRTAELARRRGWRRVILVSDASHMRRARALFARAGLPALCSPCRSPYYDIDTPADAGERYAAFHDWWSETISYLHHRQAGWA
jgi:uncharacterized SAM-binding protein YcdF (DUF218 family)